MTNQSITWPPTPDRNGDVPVLLQLLGSSEGNLALHASMLAAQGGALQKDGWQMDAFLYPLPTKLGGITLPLVCRDPEGKDAIVTVFNDEWTKADIDHHLFWLKAKATRPELDKVRFILMTANGKAPEEVTKHFEHFEVRF